MKEVPIGKLDLERFAPLIGEERAITLRDRTAKRALDRLEGRCVLNVNSTAAGGGVAEMLHVILGYVRGIGVDTRWIVIDAPPEFFEITKRIHNRLYGSPGDGGELGEREHEVYEEALRDEAAELAACARSGDFVILHDPQTAGLAEHARSLGCRVVWRCHVGIDEQNEHSREGWEFLRRYLEPWVDGYVFTNERFPPDWVPKRNLHVIWPSIDPFSPKNQDMSPETAEAILTHAGVIAGRPGDTSFRRPDGSPGRVERFCDVFRTGAPADAGAPMVVQVSRWDGMKDMEGVMKAFAEHVPPSLGAELVLAGPVVSAVADDPEGGQVLQNCWNAWRHLPHAVRHRVQLACLPMHDLDENAAIVNALQRHASIVTQKSLAEGFGLTVAEAMLKGRPVIASAVGGMVHQVIHEETGLLVRDPADLDEFGRAVCRLLEDDELRERLGEGARRRAIDAHLGDIQLANWFEVLSAIDDGA